MVTNLLSNVKTHILHNFITHIFSIFHTRLIFLASIYKHSTTTSKRQLSNMKYKTIVDSYMTWWFKHCSSLLSNYSVIKLYFVTMILGESKRRQVLLCIHIECLNTFG